MSGTSYQFQYERFESIEKLTDADAELLTIARTTTARAYAPYSRFFVGAAGRLRNQQILTGTNQENASFPAGICAERVLLSALASLYPGEIIDSLAVSYQTASTESNHPISPCGICRQSLMEQERKQGTAIRIILGGQTGPVYIISTVSHLLPLSFTGEELNRG